MFKSRCWRYGQNENVGEMGIIIFFGELGINILSEVGKWVGGGVEMSEIWEEHQLEITFRKKGKCK